MIPLVCKICGAAAALHDATVVTRSCEHAGAPVVASMRAVMVGRNGIGPPPPPTPGR